MILFVDCNDVCRAMIAAAVCRKKYGLAAGHAGDYAVEGQKPDGFAARAAESAGLDIAGERAIALTDELVRAADRVVGVSRSIAVHMKENYTDCADKIEHMNISDPFGQGEKAYENCVNEIEKQLEERYGAEN